MRSKYFIYLVGVLFLVLLVAAAGDVFGGRGERPRADRRERDADCNVQGILVRGVLVTYFPPEFYNESGDLAVDATSADEVVANIREANEDGDIAGILLEVDSGGGSPVAAEEIARALRASEKPAVAFIRGAGLSAAYWAATGARTIFASRNSDVGSIGVTLSYLDRAKQHEREGLTYNQLSIGKFKDVLDPDKALTPEEKTLLERDLKVVYENFVDDVSVNRKLSADKVRALADGSSLLGQLALEAGLVDRIGGEREALSALEELIDEDASVCWR